MLAQILIASGAALLGLLGTIHIIATFFTNKLDPREPATIAAMKATGLVLGGTDESVECLGRIKCNSWSVPVAFCGYLSVTGRPSHVLATRLTPTGLVACR